MLFKAKKCSNCEGYYDPTLEKCPNCHKRNELYTYGEINSNVAFMHPIAQIGLFLGGFSLVGMLVVQLILAPIIRGIGDKSLKEAMLYTFTYLLMFAGLAIIILLTRRERFFSKYKKSINYIYGLGYAITLVLAGSLVGNFISIFHTVSDNANQAAVVDFSHNYPILAFFVLGILGPVCEELTYRVGLYSFLRRFNKYLAIVITTLVFAFIHFEFIDVDIVEELWAMPQYIVSGLILTIAYEHRGPACSMVAHVLYNIFALVMVLLG